MNKELHIDGPLIAVSLRMSRYSLCLIYLSALVVIPFSALSATFRCSDIFRVSIPDKKQEIKNQFRSSSLPTNTHTDHGPTRVKILNTASPAIEILSDKKLSINDRFTKIERDVYDPVVRRILDYKNDSKEKQDAHWVKRALYLKERLFVVYRLLQEAFYPLLDRISDHISRTSPATVRLKMAEISEEYPIRRGDFAVENNYRGTFAYPLIEDSGRMIKGANQTIESNINSTNHHNIREAATRRFANLWNAKGMGQRRKFLRVDPDLQMAREIGDMKLSQSLYITPVGEYGEETAKKLLRSTQIISKLILENKELRSLSLEVFSQSESLLRKETARGQMATAERAEPSLSPLSASIEGVLSLHQLFSFLLAKKIDGIVNGDEALREIIFNSGENEKGLISEITTRMPSGLIGPIGISGHHFTDKLIRNNKGRLALSPKMIELLRRLVDKSSDLNAKSRCPMAGILKPGDKKPGLQKLAEAYYVIFKSL